MKLKFIYIHGLDSNLSSRKYIDLREYFRGEFDFAYMEWENDDAISEVLDQTESVLENEKNPILFEDSKGANFAWPGLHDALRARARPVVGAGLCRGQASLRGHLQRGTDRMPGICSKCWFFSIYIGRQAIFPYKFYCNVPQVIGCS